MWPVPRTYAVLGMFAVSCGAGLVPWSEHRVISLDVEARATFALFLEGHYAQRMG